MATFSVDSKQGWQGKFKLDAGNGFVVRPSGTWKFDPGRSAVGAGGIGPSSPNMPVTNCNQGCLLINITPLGVELGFGSVYCFTSDTAMQSFTPDQVPKNSGISFRINDDNVGDNDGQLTLDVSGNITPV